MSNLDRFHWKWYDNVDHPFWDHIIDSGQKKWPYDLPPNLKLIHHPIMGRSVSVMEKVPPNTIIYKFIPIHVRSDNILGPGECEYVSIFKDIKAYYERHQETALDAMALIAIKLFVVCEMQQELKKAILHLKHDRSFCEPESLIDPTALRISNSIIESSRKDECPKLYYLVHYVKKLLEIVILNSGTLQDRLTDTYGYFIEPLFSLINHSCLPNVKLVYTGGSCHLKLVSTTTIKNTLYINYCPRIEPLDLRRSFLNNQFGFSCHCEMCESKIDYLFSYNCPKCEHFLCYPKFKSFLYSHNVSFLSGKYLHCKNCNYIIDAKLFQTNYIVHKYAMLITNYLVYNCYKQHNFLKFLKVCRSLTSSTTICTPYHLSYLSHYEFPEDTPQVFFEIFEIMLLIIVKSKIIPVYCYPFSIMCLSLQLRALESLEDKRDPELHLSAFVSCIRATFLVSLPNDLTHHYKVCNSQFYDIALHLYCYITESQDNSNLNNLKGYIWVCMFFCARAFESYRLHNISICRGILKFYLKLSKHRIDFKNISFKDYLIPMLETCGVYQVLKYKKKKLSIAMISRNNLILFDEERDSIIINARIL